MPTKLFFDLNEEKRKKIIEICTVEFSQYGYSGSSTNRIIHNAGISKGSLFKYFPNKEDLYFYILDVAVMELIATLEKEIDNLPSDLFDRTIKYSELEFVWYIEHPEKCKLITNAFSKSDYALRRKIENRYDLQGLDLYYKVLENIDISTLKWDKQKTVDIFKWFLLGFKEDFISRIQFDDFTDIEQLRNEYVKGLADYILLLKSGLMIEKSEE